MAQSPTPQELNQILKSAQRFRAILSSYNRLLAGKKHDDVPMDAAFGVLCQLQQSTDIIRRLYGVGPTNGTGWPVMVLAALAFIRRAFELVTDAMNWHGLFDWEDRKADRTAAEMIASTGESYQMSHPDPFPVMRRGILDELDEAIRVLEDTMKPVREYWREEAEAQARAVDAQKKTGPIQPDNPDVRDLCRLLEKHSSAKTLIQIAREFTGEKPGDERKAQSLLRQARRFRHLWGRADS